MGQVLASLADGLLLGFVYGMAAMGLSLIWGVMRVINLCHGAVMTLGMFATYLLFTTLGMNPYLALLIVAVLGLLFGFVVYGVAVHPVINAPHLSSLLATFSVNMIIIGVGTAIFTTSPRNIDFSRGIGQTSVRFTLQGTRLDRGVGHRSADGGAVSLPLSHVPRQVHPRGRQQSRRRRADGHPVGARPGAELWHRHHAGGVGRRADLDVLSVHDPERRRCISPGLRHLRPGRAGQSPRRADRRIDPGDDGGADPHLHAGQLGAGRRVCPLRRDSARAAAGPVGSAVDDRLAPTRVLAELAGGLGRRARRRRWRGTARCARWCFTLLMFAALASSLNIMMGYTGYVNFGHIVFFGLGGYTGFYLISQHNWWLYPAVVAGGLASAAVAGLLGSAILRLRGAYFALATIGINEAARAFVNNFDPFGGPTGMFVNFAVYRRYGGAAQALWMTYTVLLVVTVLVLIVSAMVKHSQFGLGLMAIREDEDAAEVMGVECATLQDHGLRPLGDLSGHGRHAVLLQERQRRAGRRLPPAHVHRDARDGHAGRPGHGARTRCLGAITYERLRGFLLTSPIFKDLHLAVAGLLLLVIVLFVPAGVIGWLRARFPRLRRVAGRDSPGQQRSASDLAACRR